jgi:hypothetical protein
VLQTLRRRISSVVDGVGLDQVGIKLVLADELAEAVADLGSTVVSVLAIDRLGWELLRLPDCLEPQHQPGGIPHVVLVRDTGKPGRHPVHLRQPCGDKRQDFDIYATA